MSDQHSTFGTEAQGHLKRYSDRLLDTVLPDSVISVLDQAAANHPDRIAVNWFETGRQLSYGALKVNVDAVAANLMNLGVRKHTHVAVMLSFSPEWVTLFLALAKLGAVNVPINTAYTAHELEYILGFSDAQFAIAESEYTATLAKIADALPLLDTSRILEVGDPSDDFDNFEDLLKPVSDISIPWSASATDLMTFQPTSGTTGFPKLCMLPQGYWLRMAQRECAFYAVPLGVERILIWQPPYYMAGPFRLMLTLFLGGTAFVPQKMSVTKFADWLADYGIHYCTFPEWAFRAQKKRLLDKNFELKYVHTFAWTAESQSAFFKQTSIPCVEGFGMSEIGLVSITPVEIPELVGLGTCGFVAPESEMCVFDDDFNEVDDGKMGELAIAGSTVFDGYYKAATANSDSFHGRWFRTGDYFIRDAAGLFYFKGRKKELIKRSGENTSAREVEEAILGLENVAEVAAIPVADEARNEEVKVVVRLLDGLSDVDCSPAEIMAICQERLARFKWPRYIAYCSDYPRTPTRKIKKLLLLIEDNPLIYKEYDVHNIE